jgi:cholesterol oxidase
MTDFDAVVIGTGFGGAVSACRLGEAGYRVLVLERGRRWTAPHFPRGSEDAWIWDVSCPELCNGLFDLRFFRHMIVAQGAAVGGGSIVYANISCEARQEAFDQGWPGEITYAGLKAYYDRVADFMCVSPVPDKQWTERMKLMKEAAEKLKQGARFAKLDLAVSFDETWTYEDWSKGAQRARKFTNKHGAQQGTCVHLGNCDIGCEVNARNTLDLNYLYVAENRFHVEIRPLHIATIIEPTNGGYRVTYDSIENKVRRKGGVTAKSVFLCAGSLGSTELLLQCRDVHKTLPGISNMLGKGWSGNGDFLTPAVHLSRRVDADRGPTIASRIDFHDASQGGQRFWIEDGGIPNIAVAYVDAKLSDPAIGWKTRMLMQYIKTLLRDAGGLTHVMPWFAQGVDAADGSLVLRNSNGKPLLDLQWDIRKSEKVIDEIVSMHKRLAGATGGVPLVSPSWSLFRDLITPHPLGGCNMGNSSDSGVVDHVGQVFGYPRLHVLDGSIVPRALGVNPSRTIAALAERACELITHR